MTTPKDTTTPAAAQELGGSAGAALLAWIDEELEYHQWQMDSIGDAADTDSRAEFRGHNMDHLRLTQLRNLVTTASMLKLWYWTLSPDIPEEVRLHPDWPGNNNDQKGHLWERVPLATSG